MAELFPGALIVVVGLGAVAAGRLLRRADRRIAAAAFGFTAVLGNLTFAAACVAPCFHLLVLLSLVWLFLLLPSTAAFGVAWADVASREGAANGRVSSVRGAVASAIVILPLVTLWTLWPLRLSFLVSRPILERLADRAASGEVLGSPSWAGAFRIASTAVDPASGHVGLLIDPNPNGPTGFVRRARGSFNRPSRPIRGDVLSVDLGAGWWYQEED
jgi:hypothetical protein